MPRPRLTIRRLMLVVAVVGLVCGGESLRQRRLHFLDRAKFFETVEHEERESIADEGSVIPQYRAAAEALRRSRVARSDGIPDKLDAQIRWNEGQASQFVLRVRGYQRKAERFALLAEKYERLARYPWLPVPPDPPEPE